MSKKDPAFLFYPKDWLQGTSQLMPEEKGVFIDLLAQQHQDGSLPTDTKRLSRMVGLSESDFLIIWETLKHKFTETEGNRLVNRKLTEITTERLTKSATNKISGAFAAIVRLSPESWETKELLKKSFKTDAFLTVPAQNLTERLTEWWAERLKSIGNGNGNGNTVLNRGKNKKTELAKKIDSKRNVAVFADGTEQALGESQLFKLERGELTPNQIVKGHSY